MSWGLLAAAERAELPYGTVPLDLIPQLDERLPPMRAKRASEHRVLFLGDSLAIDTKGPDTSIPVRLGQKLAEAQPGGLAVELVAYTGPGLGLFSHYFLSQRVIDREPDQIVLAVNLRSFSKRWRADERSQLAGWLPAEGWPEALALPLHAVEVSADRLFFYRALVALGAFDAWHWLQREQVRLAYAYWSAARWLQAAARVENGLAFRMLHKQAELRRDKTSAFRATPYAARTLLGPALRGLAPDDPALEVLDALLRRFEAAGIAVLVYVAPINVEHLSSIGAYDRTGHGAHERADRGGLTASGRRLPRSPRRAARRRLRGPPRPPGAGRGAGGLPGGGRSPGSAGRGAPSGRARGRDPLRTPD